MPKDNRGYGMKEIALVVIDDDEKKLLNGIGLCSSGIGLYAEKAKSGEGNIVQHMNRLKQWWSDLDKRKEKFDKFYEIVIKNFEE